MSEVPERYITSADRHPDCIFCSEEITARVVASNQTVYAIEDKYPVTQVHLLIIPYRHTVGYYFSMTKEEKHDAEALLEVLRSKVLEGDKSVTGFNIGMNCGEVAGQTVMHAHIHLIPRRQGDTPEPRGGVRGCIPEKMDY